MTVADALPEYGVRTRHALRVAAAPERALAAVREVRVREARLLRLLFALRGLRAAGDRRVWDVLAKGFAPFDDETLVTIGRPWQVRGGRVGLGNSLLPGRFRAFDEPGWAKLAVDFRAEDGLLVTETRVLLTDAAARRSFRRYWLVVRPFSGLVRRSWLRAARRRAERQP